MLGEKKMFGLNKLKVQSTHQDKLLFSILHSTNGGGGVRGKNTLNLELDNVDSVWDSEPVWKKQISATASIENSLNQPPNK